MTTAYEPLRNCLSASMWEEDGIQYRSNTLHSVGAKIQLHEHSYDHTARIRGRMRMTVDDVISEVANEEIFIPAWKRHGFELIEGIEGVGEVLCFWSVA